MTSAQIETRKKGVWLDGPQHARDQVHCLGLRAQRAEVGLALPDVELLVQGRLAEAVLAAWVPTCQARLLGPGQNAGHDSLYGHVLARRCAA